MQGGEERERRGVVGAEAGSGAEAGAEAGAARQVGKEGPWPGPQGCARGHMASRPAGQWYSERISVQIESRGELADLCLDTIQWIAPGQEPWCGGLLSWPTTQVVILKPANSTSPHITSPRPTPPQHSSTPARFYTPDGHFPPNTRTGLESKLANFTVMW